MLPFSREFQETFCDVSVSIIFPLVAPDEVLNPKKKVFEQVQVYFLFMCAMLTIEEN